MAEPQVFMLFCEDVREEIGNKSSLMGLLGPIISLDEGEAKNGRLKSLVIGALCRFFDSESRDGEFEVRFIPASEDVETPPEPGVASLRLEPNPDDKVWTTNILGTFANLPVHVGMKIESTLRIDGQEYSASLVVEENA